MIVGESLTDLTNLAGYETYLGQGDKVELRIYSDGLPEDRLMALESELRSRINLIRLVQESRILSIQFKESLGSLSAIVSVIGPALSNVQGWQLFKESSIWAGVAIGVGLIVTLLLFGRRKYVLG